MNATMFHAALRSGRFYTLSVKMPEDSSCSGYIPGMQVIACKEDIEVQFGMLRKNNQKHCNNTIILIHDFSEIAVQTEPIEEMDIAEVEEKKETAGE